MQRFDMAKCAHFNVCGIEADTIPEGGHCILHAQDPDKDRNAFAEAFEDHLARDTGDFRHIHFCGTANFADRTFEEWTCFIGATFEKADFSRAEFRGPAEFGDATFAKATFLGAKFNQPADFYKATFEAASFEGAMFETAYFSKTTFGEVDFHWATLKEVDFSEATFCKRADFSYCTFRGGALFDGSSQSALFAGAEVDFRDVTLDPLNAVAFRNADLSRCRLLNTDAREMEFTSVAWCRKPSRWPRGKGTVCVYDELADEDEDVEKAWGRLERLYRELKQNYEGRRDYGRAGDFHFREKEMRKHNSHTPLGHKVLLWLYKAVSGYGERIWPAVAWLCGVVLGCAALYLVLGITPAGAPTPLVWSGNAYGSALLYSAQTSFFIEPDGYALTEGAQWTRLFQAVLSPILLGLIALAVRQRLKR